VVTGRMLSLLPAERVTALAGGPVTIDLDTTDVEVYGSKKRGVAYNHQGQRVGRPHGAAWAETEIVLAADLGGGTDDPRATAPGLLRRALAALPQRARRSGRVALRADAGYFAGQLARAAHDAHIAFAIGAKRIAPPWRLLAGIAGDAWHDAIEMDNAQVAVAEYCPDWWPDTRLLVRRVALEPEKVSADPRPRRRRTLHPDQRALPLGELAGAEGNLRLLVHPDQLGRVRAGQGGGGRALVPAPHHGGTLGHLTSYAQVLAGCGRRGLPGVSDDICRGDAVPDVGRSRCRAWGAPGAPRRRARWARRLHDGPR
jgi:hypothetical protein